MAKTSGNDSVAVKSAPKPKEIVEEWQKEFVTALKPWSLVESKDVEDHKLKLEKNIAKMIGNGDKFTAEVKENSLRVARDAAEICKILQPDPHPKKVGFDTLQLVLKVCAKAHMSCSGAGGGGGWCDV